MYILQLFRMRTRLSWGVKCASTPISTCSPQNLWQQWGHDRFGRMRMVPVLAKLQKNPSLTRGGEPTQRYAGRGYPYARYDTDALRLVDAEERSPLGDPHRFGNHQGPGNEGDQGKRDPPGCRSAKYAVQKAREGSARNNMGTHFQSANNTALASRIFQIQI